MWSVLKLTYNTYQWCLSDLSDPRTENMFLMKNPFHWVLLIAIYLAFVLYWGPKFMQNRKPYNIEKFLIVYNVLQIVFSANLLIRALKDTYVFGGYSFICQPVDFSTSEHGMMVVDGVHDYFMLKIFDLLDTVFIVLRKKWNQITFLHLYHHAGMIGLVWLAARFLPGGQSLFVGFLNCFVHIIMYSYYLISLRKTQAHLWWKKYLTQLQILQFILIEIAFITPIVFPCGYPKIACVFMLIQNTCMLTLFSEFYYRTYIKKPAVKS